MTLTYPEIPTGGSDTMNRQHNAPTHCVFRSEAAWQALPAELVREVIPRPVMIAVPHTPPTFAGLCHVRSEFVPVLNLKRMQSDANLQEGNILVVLDDADGPWGILVDEVTALQRLEMSDAPEAENSPTSNCHAENIVVGWATERNRVIQILDIRRIRELAEQHLDSAVGLVT